MSSMSPDGLVQFALNHNCIQDRIGRNSSYKGQIERAAQVLSGLEHITEENIVRSIHKSADAVINGINIFISYKHEDFLLADTLKQIIKKLGGKSINQVFMSQDSNAIPPGSVWRERICSALQQCNWVYLLLPGVAMDRGWVLYEAGMFQASRLPGDKLIWFYNSDQPEASQIDDLQGVKLITEGPDSIYEFLKYEFLEPDAVPGMDPIAEGFYESDLMSFATQLASTVQPISDQRRVYYVDYLDLVVDKKEEFSVDNLKESKILHCSDARAIFGRENVTTFGELVSLIDDELHGNLWINELADAIKSILNNKFPAPMQATFQGHTEGRSYRPLLYTTRVRDDETIDSFHIALTPSLSTPMSRQPRELEALMTAFRQGYRFRWEVLEEYDRKLSIHDIGAVERIVQRMEAESISHGAYDEEILSRAFDRPADKQKIRELFKHYSEFRTESANGKLDDAFQKNDPTMLRKCLGELRTINNEFMRLASQQIFDSIQKYWT